MSRPAELEPLGPGYAELYDRIAAAIAEQPGVRRLVLGGSLARGDADAYSDLDLVVEVDDPARFDAAAVVRAATPTTLLRELPFGVIAITPEWLRLDLVVMTAPAASPVESSSEVRGLAEEFLRVLGLLPVVAGRDEWIVGWNGVALLRKMLLDLLLAESGDLASTGAKRINPKLTDEQRALISGLPPLTATGESVIGGHVAAANAFLPRAKRLLEPWPADFETATRNHLRRELGIELDP